MALVVRNPPANAGDKRNTSLVPCLEDPLEEGMTTHFSILAWRIPRTEEPGGLQSIGWQESDTIEVTEHASIYRYIHMFTHTHTHTMGKKTAHLHKINPIITQSSNLLLNHNIINLILTSEIWWWIFYNFPSFWLTAYTGIKGVLSAPVTQPQEDLECEVLS